MKQLFAVIFTLLCGYAQAATYYICDCQSGSTTGCTPGAATAPQVIYPNSTGTANGQHKTWGDLLTNKNIAGNDTILWCEGGKWIDAAIGLGATGAVNTEATPITYGSYTPTNWSSRKTAAVTVTAASPAVVTWTAHTLSANNTLQFTTTGTLPAGLELNVTYYVVPGSITANTFKISRYRGETLPAGPYDPCTYLPATVGCNVALTTTGTGTLTAVAYERPWLYDSRANYIFKSDDGGANVADGGYILQDLHFDGGGSMPISVAVSTLTGTGTVATVTTASAHGLVSGNLVYVESASAAGFNSTSAPRTSQTITVTGATTFTYSCVGSCTPSATGSFYTVDPVGANYGGLFINSTTGITMQRLEIHDVSNGIYSQQFPDSPATKATNRRLTVRDSYIHHAPGSSILGGAFDLLFENNLLDRNGDSFIREHDIYLSSSNGAVRFNTMTRTTMDGLGRCVGSPVEVHGRNIGLSITDNRIILNGATSTCYGIEMDTAYDDTPAPYDPNGEAFQKNVIARNQIVCPGYFGIAVMGHQDTTIENNSIVWPSSTCAGGAASAPGVAFITTDGGGASYSPNDQHNARITIRNNSGYNNTNYNLAAGIKFLNEGTGYVVANNVFYYGAAANTAARCYQFNSLPQSSFALFNNNLCFSAAASVVFSDLSGALWASRPAGWDTNGLSTDPLFVAAPTDANGYSLNIQAGSPAIGAGNTTSRSALQLGNLVPGNVDTLGAYKRGSVQAPSAPGRVVVQ